MKVLLCNSNAIFNCAHLTSGTYAEVEEARLQKAADRAIPLIVPEYELIKRKLKVIQTIWPELTTYIMETVWGLT